MVSAFLFSVLHTPFPQVPSSLDDLEKSFASVSGKNYDFVKLQEINAQVFGIIESDQLKGPNEFYRAASLLSEFRNSFEVSRVKHELTLCALAGGDEKSKAAISHTWDMFLISTGREQRVGTMKIPNEPRFALAPAPKSVLNVMSNPTVAMEIASKTKSDAEVTIICADDQSVRQQDWSKLTVKQMEEMSKSDKARLKRIIELLSAGRIVTAEDFDHASLVLQHGSCWRDYSLAHELSICSLLLGNKKAAWLSAATYDRMLGSGGYRQRFGTQYGSVGGGKFTLDAFDTTAISDSQRKALHCPTLEEAKNRKWD